MECTGTVGRPYHTFVALNIFYVENDIRNGSWFDELDDVMDARGKLAEHEKSVCKYIHIDSSYVKCF